jgi:tRNA G18 (ribose-2'-O)-methylase SpoU
MPGDRGTAPVPTIAIDDPGDPRVAAYVGLTDAELRREVEAADRIFVVEGELALAQLLRSPYPLRSVLVAGGRLAPVAALLGDAPGVADVPVYVAGPTVLNQVVGFNLHRGVVAVAGRLPPASASSVVAGRDRIAVLEGVNDHENLGGLFRNAAAFGIGAVLLDPRCADPLYRRCVRVSIGHVLRIPMATVDPWPAGLGEVRSAGFTVVALTPSAGAEPISSLAADAPAKVAFLLGAEGPGLSEDALAAADRRVRIPIAAGVDSVNVATAAAIAFHRLYRPESTGAG